MKPSGLALRTGCLLDVDVEPMSRRFLSSGLDVRSEKSRKGSDRNESWLRHAHLPERDDARTETLFLQHQFGRVRCAFLNPR